MEQQFSALFTCLRQKLASSELVNTVPDVAGSLQPAASLDEEALVEGLYPTQQSVQPENALLLRVQGSFLDQHQLVQPAYTAIVSRLDSRLEKLRQVHHGRLATLSDERAFFAGRVKELRAYFATVDKLRRWHDNRMFFQAQQKIQLLLEQCKGEIVKETRRLRAHNRLQFETLSSAAIAVRQLAVYQKLLALLMHESKVDVQINNIGIVAHTRGSHLPKQREREHLALAAATVSRPGTSSSLAQLAVQDQTGESSAQNSATASALPSSAHSNDILLLWNRDARFRGSCNLAKEVLDRFLQQDVDQHLDHGNTTATRNDDSDTSSVGVVSQLPEFYAIVQIAKTVVTSRSTKKHSGSAKQVQAAEGDLSNAIERAWEHCNHAAELVSKLDSLLHLSSSSSRRTKGLNAVPNSNKKKSVSPKVPTQKTPTGSPIGRTQGMDSPADSPRLFSATTPLTSSSIHWVTSPRSMASGFLYYCVGERGHFLNPAAAPREPIGSSSTFGKNDWMAKEERTRTNQLASNIETEVFSQFGPKHKPSRSEETTFRVVSQNSNVQVAVNDDGSQTVKIPTVYSAVPSSTLPGTNNVPPQAFAVASVRQLLRCKWARNLIMASCSAEQKNQLAGCYGSVIDSVDDKNLDSDAYSSLFILQRSSASKQTTVAGMVASQDVTTDPTSRHNGDGMLLLVPLNRDLYKEMCLYYVRLAFSQPPLLRAESLIAGVSTSERNESVKKQASGSQEHKNAKTAAVPSQDSKDACGRPLAFLRHIEAAAEAASVEGGTSVAKHSAPTIVTDAIAPAASSFHILQLRQGELSESMLEVEDVVATARAKRDRNRWNDGVVGSGECGLCEAEGQIPAGSKYSSTGTSSPRLQQPGRGIKHFSAAKRAIAAKASGSRRAKLNSSIGGSRNGGEDSDRHEVVLKKHVYVVHKIDLSLKGRRHLPAMNSVSAAKVRTDAGMGLHSTHSGVGSGDEYEDSFDDDYDDGDFENEEENSKEPKSISGTKINSGSEPMHQHACGDELGKQTAAGTCAVKRRSRHFCAWLGCTEAVFDSSDPADMLYLGRIAGGMDEPGIASLQRSAFTLCATHARTLHAFCETKSGRKELRKYLRNFSEKALRHGSNDTNRKLSSRKGKRASGKQDFSHVDISLSKVKNFSAKSTVQQGGLGDGSPLLRELKDGKLQSTIHAFWKRLGTNLRRSAMTQLQALCWTTSSDTGPSIANGEGKNSESPNLDHQIEAQEAERALLIAEARELASLVQLERKISRVLQSTSTLCAKSQVFVDYDELSSLFAKEAAQLKAKAASTRDETTISKQTADLLQLHYEVDYAKRKLQIASSVRDHVLETIASLGDSSVRGSSKHRRQFSGQSADTFDSAVFSPTPGGGIMLTASDVAATVLPARSGSGLSQDGPRLVPGGDPGALSGLGGRPGPKLSSAARAIMRAATIDQRVGTNGSGKWSPKGFLPRRGSGSSSLHKNLRQSPFLKGTKSNGKRRGRK